METKSTNIDQLPSVNSLASQNNNDDDIIAEVLEEIQNENNANNNGPQPPMETMPQGPSKFNIQQPMQHPMQQNPNINNIQPQMQQMRQRPVRIMTQQIPIMQSPPNFDQKSMQQNLLDDLKTQLLAENFTDQKQKDYDNRTAKLIDDAKKNSSLLIVIFVTNIMLQNNSIKNIILSKFSRFENPYLNLAILSLVQVALVFLFKNFS